MKKQLISLVLLVSAINADTIELQIEGWQTQAFGTFQNNGSAIDLKERGLENDIAPSISLDYKGDNKYSNFKFNYTHIDTDNKKILTADMQHNGVNFDDTEMLKTTLQMDVVDAIYYVSDDEKNKLYNFDIGLGLRYVDGSFQTKICTKETTSDFNKFIPIGYLRVEVTPEWSQPAKWVNQLIWSPIDNVHLDLKTALKTDVYKNLNAEIGYRYSEYSMSDDYTTNIKVQGPYVGLGYRF